MKMFTLILILFSITACDPNNNGSYVLKNTSSKKLNVYFHSINDIERDTLELPKKSTEVWRVDTYTGGGNIKIILENVYDSIRVESQGIIIIKYTPQTSGKSIYDYSYWTENKKGRRDYEYTFEITDDDLN